MTVMTETSHLMDASAAATTPDTALVEVRELAKTFDVSAPWLNRVVERKPRQFVHAVDGVSCTIEKGRTLALVGESSSMTRSIVRIRWLPRSHVIPTATVSWCSPVTRVPAAGGSAGPGSRDPETRSSCPWSSRLRPS